MLKLYHPLSDFSNLRLSMSTLKHKNEDNSIFFAGNCLSWGFCYCEETPWPWQFFKGKHLIWTGLHSKWHAGRCGARKRVESPTRQSTGSRRRLCPTLSIVWAWKTSQPTPSQGHTSSKKTIISKRHLGQRHRTVIQLNVPSQRVGSKGRLALLGLCFLGSVLCGAGQDPQPSPFLYRLATGATTGKCDNYPSKYVIVRNTSVSYRIPNVRSTW